MLLHGKEALQGAQGLKGTDGPTVVRVGEIAARGCAGIGCKKGMEGLGCMEKGVSVMSGLGNYRPSVRAGMLLHGRKVLEMTDRRTQKSS